MALHGTLGDDGWWFLAPSREMMMKRFRPKLELVKTAAVRPVAGGNFDEEREQRLPRQ